MLGRWVSDLTLGDVLPPVDYVLTPFMVREYAHSVEETSERFHGASDAVGLPTMSHADKVRALEARVPPAAPGLCPGSIWSTTPHITGPFRSGRLCGSPARSSTASSAGAANGWRSCSRSATQRPASSTRLPRHVAHHRAGPLMSAEPWTAGTEVARLSRTMTAERMRWFADGLHTVVAAGDTFQIAEPNIHTDDDLARASGLPGIIADGMVSTNWISSC